jgi:hypothetical protein
MDSTIKKTVAIVVSVAIIVVTYIGSYLPLRKAQSYIATLQGFQNQPPTSLQDLETRLSVPLDAPSPIGQEEVVRNTANSVLGLIQHGIDATSTAELMDFLSSYYEPIFTRGRGMSFGQDVYLEGALNEVAFSQTGDPNYLAGAQHYYALGEQLGPNRPQPLYGLFDVYREEGDVTDTVAIANKILANWPTDPTVSSSLATFLKAVSAAKH